MSKRYWLALPLLTALFALGLGIFRSQSAAATPFLSCDGGGRPTVTTSSQPGTLAYSCGDKAPDTSSTRVDGSVNARVVCPEGKVMYFMNNNSEKRLLLWCAPAGSSLTDTSVRVAPTSYNDLSGPGASAGPGSSVTPGDGSLEEPTQDSQDCSAGASCINNNYLVIMGKWIINILSALVAVVVVGVIVFAGIEYSSSGGDPGKTAAAKKRIVNAIIALVAYMFLYVALQWLIPGGLFG